MRRAGPVHWLTHDVTHRGVTAWALASVLLGFYFGLYLTAETRQLAWKLGVAVPVHPPAQIADLGAGAPMHLRFPGAGAWGVWIVIAALTTGVYGYFTARDAGFRLTPEARAKALRVGGYTFALCALTTYASLFFANLLEPAERQGRHLLPPPGHSWPAWALALTLVPLVGGAVASLVPVVENIGHRAVALRKFSLTLALLSGVLLVLLYGTHVFDPGRRPPDGEHSLRAFMQLVYFAMDSKWSLYGLVYTMAVLTGGVYMLGKYLHNRYQVVRTLVVMLVQSTFGFSVPVLLGMFAQPQYYLSYFWPLKIDAFYPDNILRDPVPFVLWSFVGSLLFVPIMGVFFGKRWYCSWVCGCGGLANTAGEPFRPLSAKGEAAWKFEKAAIYTTLGVAVVTTLLVVLSAFVAREAQPAGVWWGGHGDVGQYRFDPVRSNALVGFAGKARYYYGILVVAVLSGAIGVGLYPLGGTRQWCRNFCPMAAFLGLIQKFSRFRIRVKEDMCISCGLCTKYCEMGIDVRSYAQANQTFARASCVGCGMCAEVCPRGVLALEQRFARDPQERHTQLVQIRLRK